MPTATAMTPPIQALPDTPAPKKAFGLTHVQPKHAFSPCHCKLDLLFSSTVPHPPAPSVELQLSSTTDSDYDANSTMPQGKEKAEDEYTLSAYGDISLGEISDFGELQSKIPQHHLRLKVRRPPMPKRRLNHVYVPDPLPYTGGIASDERWPGSPRPTVNSSSWLQDLLPLFPLPPTWGNKPVKSGAPSLERLADELLPRSPSIQLSPPGSPASQALSLPQKTHGQQSGIQQGGKLPKANNTAAKPPQSPPAPVRQQDKPWRTRLPPRPPIPKWDL